VSDSLGNEWVGFVFVFKRPPFSQAVCAKKIPLKKNPFFPPNRTLKFHFKYFINFLKLPIR
jgi:hypothetical protein